MEKGRVYITGAGPGDERLVTVRCRELIENADVIVYDRLASEKLLCYAKEDCELIYAGKEPKNHTLNQQEINNVLVKKARENKSVLRLKGGDPFIFGRGGEEAERLFDEGIEFEVVPGISSFYSVCAYAGIPVTHRDYASSVHVFTGHKKNDGEIDFKSVAKLKGTLVFLMSMKNLSNITKELMANGMDKNIPSAVIQWGTTPKQKPIIGTLGDIAEKAKEEKINHAAIAVIGDVVKAREKIEWQKYRPLWKKKIAVTRTTDKIGEIEKVLSEKGAFVMPFPTIKIGEPNDYTALDNAIYNISKYSLIVFTSVNGVDSFFGRMRKLHKDIRSLSNIKIFAIGKRTKEAIEERGIFVDLMPEKYNSDMGGKLIAENIHEGDFVLYPTSDIAGDSIVEAVEKVGGSVDKITAYTNTVNTDINSSVLEDIRNGGYDAVVFASSSQAENFINIVGKENINSKIFSIGVKTTETLEKMGVKVDATAEVSTIEGVCDTVLKELL